MSRSLPTTRRADMADVPVLREIWADVLRPVDRERQLADVASIVDSCLDAEDRCVAVAECDGEVAGAVYLEARTITPLNLEPVALTVSPHVLPRFRRRGVGTALLDAATRFAENRDIVTVASAARSTSRDANRFLARVGLAPQATLRSAPTAVIRAKLSARGGIPSRRRRGQVDRVLAARRLEREQITS